MKIHYYILLAVLCSLLTFFACGLPNPLGTSSNVNFSHLVKTYSSNQTVFLKIHSYNTENNAPFFIGYNIYFDYAGISNEANIKNNLMLFQFQTNGPTILAFPQSSVQSSLFSFSINTKWIELANSNVIRTTNVSTEDIYYFIVTPKEEGSGDQAGDNYIRVYKEIVEHDEFNQTISIGQSFSFSNASFTFSQNFITPTAGTQIQDLGYHSNWFAVTSAPPFGYSTTSVPLVEGHIYTYLSTNTNHGKLMILSIENNTVTYHFSYQHLKGELQI